MLILTDFYNMGACAMKQINKNVKHHLKIMHEEEREYTSNNDESKTTEFYESKYMSKIEREREKKSR